MFNQQVGLRSLLKEGANTFAGVDEALLKNIEACKNITKIVSSSMGPFGQNKLIINHLNKHFVTSDTATIVQELEVQHPAAKLLVMASKAQETECGDSTNLVVTFAGELLAQAEELLKVGIHPADIIKGYELAQSKCMQFLEESVCWTLTDPRSMEQILAVVKTPLASKHYGNEDLLAKLVADACVRAMPADPTKFDVECVRTAKIIGGNLSKSEVVAGVVCTKGISGTVLSAEKVKVAVFGEGLEPCGTESKGTVLIEDAQQLMAFTKGEEKQMEEIIEGIAAAGVGAIISGGPISDIALHYLNKYKILALKVNSKFELQRICKAIRATSLVRIGVPLPEEMGYAESIHEKELASQKITVIKSADSRIATIVLRSTTPSVLEEIERGIDDAVNCCRMACKDGRFLSGAGATEIELAHRIQEFGQTLPGMDQYAVLKFAESLEVVPRTLAGTAGLDLTASITSLYNAHAKGNKHAGISVEGEGTVDACKEMILDHFYTKMWAIRHALDAALTVLRVDQIIVAKQAGGPKAE